MAYIGRGINNLSNAQILDTITFTNSAGPYNLEQGSAAFTPISPQALVISVDGVIQAPDSYTISAATITFGVSMASTLTNDFIVHNGVGIVNVPTDGSVTTAKIEDLAVTAAKLATDAVETAKIKDLNVTAGKLAATQDLSTKTITLPASVSGLGTGITNSQLAGSIDVTTKITGVVPTANLGSGSASASTYLAGDQSYKTIVATDIAWQAVTTATTLTAVAGRGYPIDTTSNACTVTLPASASVGDQIIFTDYARNFSTNALTINQNSLNYQGYSSPNPEYDTAGESIHIVYMDATKGWVPINDGAVAMETQQTYQIEFLVVAGGGSGGSLSNAGGGGTGGYRTATETGVVEGTEITITVGDGGAATSDAQGITGSASSFSGSGLTTISSAGGGGGAGASGNNGLDGGSGGGAGNAVASGGAGNTPSTSPAQGFPGGDGGTAPAYGGGGGGGSSEAGDDGSTSQGGNGGDGTASSISGSSITRGGGGGGGTNTTIGSGGTGGGGDAGAAAGGNGGDGTINTGSGGGGCESSNTSGAGGKGVIILSMPDASYSGTTTGSPTVATGQTGSKTTLVFTGTGSYTA